MRPAVARAAVHSARSISVRVRPAGSFQLSPSAKRKGRGIDQTAILVFLQPNTFALGHFRQIIQWKNQDFAVITDNGEMIAVYTCGKGRFSRLPCTVSTCLPRAGLGHHLIRRAHEPITIG